MESLYFLVPLFFIFLAIFPINIRLKGCLSLSKKIAYITLFVGKFKIKLFKASLKNNKLYISTKHKQKEIELSLSIKQIYFIDQIIDNLKDKVIIRKVVVNTKAGTNDACSTALVCGTIHSLSKILFSKLKTQKFNCSMQSNIFPCFNKPIFLCATYVSLTTNIFDIIYCILISLFAVRRNSYERYV